jgi:hypothetical protein
VGRRGTTVLHRRVASPGGGHPELPIPGEEIEMEKPRIDIREDGVATVFWNGSRYKREPGAQSGFRWRKQIEGGSNSIGESLRTLFEWIYKHPKQAIKVRRFARLPQNDSLPINGFSDIPLTTDLHIHKTKWLVDRLFAEDELILITGLPGSFKSFLAGHLAAAVSTGHDFLGRKTKRTRVLILDRDNPPHIIAERREILKMSEGSHLKIWHYWGGDPPPAIGDPRLEELARKHRLLIIFDSFVRFHDADENMTRDMVGIMGELRKLVVAGATVIVLHHRPKGDPKVKYRGSSDIHAAVDAAFSVSVNRETKPQTITLECFKHRAIQEFKMTLQPDFEHARFEVVADSTVSKTDQIIEKLKIIISADPGVSQEDVIDNSKLPQGRIRKILNEGENTHWRVERPDRKMKTYYPLI